MGTSSVLAYEIKPNKYYSQYMQFDGYPTWKGKEYYETILKSLLEFYSYFIKNNKPNSKFFIRIKHFLNNYQYASYHSFNTNTIMNADDWWKDSGQWLYLFDKNGNFIFAPPNSSNQNTIPWKCIIPWEFTLHLSRHFAIHDFNQIDGGFHSIFKPFWEFMKKWDGQTNPPNINLTTCETLAFPNQEEEGWRFTGLLSAMKEKITGMFYCIPEKRNIEHTKILYESEYLNVKKCPQKKLPLLIETLKEKNAIELLEKRLKGNPDATT